MNVCVDEKLINIVDQKNILSINCCLFFSTFQIHSTFLIECHVIKFQSLFFILAENQWEINYTLSTQKHQ